MVAGLITPLKFKDLRQLIIEIKQEKEITRSVKDTFVKWPAMVTVNFGWTFFSE